MELREEYADSEEFSSMLERARGSDFTDMINYNCIGVGYKENEPCIYVIPELGLRMQTPTYTTRQILEDMLLLFFKVSENLVQSPYSIVYGHSIFSLYTQVKMLRRLYKMLPRRYKKNLSNLYILHPTARVHAFFQMSKVLLGRHVSRIVKFVPSIIEFQRYISPRRLMLPAAFIQWEDTHFHPTSTPQHRPPPLIDLFNEQLQTPVFIAQCVEYLRQHGLHKEGIFRVAGDQVTLEVGRRRFMYGCDRILVGTDESDSMDDAPLLLANITRPANGEEGGEVSIRSPLGVPSLAYLVVSEVDEIAQLMKAFLRDLPEPVVTVATYHAIIDAVSKKKAEGMEVDAQALVDLIEVVMKEKMPREHLLTFNYILRFLAEVAAAGHINKMGPDNVSVIFAPTLMRVEMEDPMKAMTDIKICQKILRGLLLKRMEGLLTSGFSQGRFGATVR